MRPALIVGAEVAAGRRQLTKLQPILGTESHYTRRASCRSLTHLLQVLASTCFLYITLTRLIKPDPIARAGYEIYRH